MPHESAELNLVLAITGAMLLVFGLFSAWMRRSWVSGPAVAIGIGFVLGPAGFGLVSSPLFSAHEATLLVTAETTLALGVMAIEATSFLIVSLALTLVMVASAKLLGTNSILAVFMSGQAMARVVTRSERLREYEIQEAITRIFILPGFLQFGIALPVSGWIDLGWGGAALVVGMLLLRRLPILLALKQITPATPQWRDAMFVGWFGPIGIAALFYACSAAQEIGDERIWTIASLVILASTVVHGVTAMPLTRLYGRNYGRKVDS